MIVTCVIDYYCERNSRSLNLNPVIIETLYFACILIKHVWSISKCSVFVVTTVFILYFCLLYSLLLCNSVFSTLISWFFFILWISFACLFYLIFCWSLVKYGIRVVFGMKFHVFHLHMTVAYYFHVYHQTTSATNSCLLTIAIYYIYNITFFYYTKYTEE